MRLFVGVEVSESMKAGATTIADELRDQFTRVAPSAVLRWVTPSNLHITLWFLGEVDDTRASAIRDALDPPFVTHPFDLHAAGAGLFPASGPPRALWVGLTHGAASLVAVYNELIPRFVRLGFEPERRPYSPHLTIARFKDIGRKDVGAVRRAAGACVTDAGGCRIAAVTLFRSRLSPNQPPPRLPRSAGASAKAEAAQYEPLLRVPLI